MFSKTKHDSTKCIGAECKISKIEAQNDSKMVPGRGSDSTFSGCLTRLGWVFALGSIFAPSPPSPESLLAAFWGCWGTFWPPSWPLKTHLEAREKWSKIDARQEALGNPLDERLKPLRVPKWKQVGFKIPFPQGCVLKTAYTLKILRFLYSKYDFGMSRGIIFHVTWGVFLIYERVGFRTPFGSPFSDFWAILEANLASSWGHAGV